MSINRKDFLHLLGFGSLSAMIPVGDYNTPAGNIIKPKVLKQGDTIGLISPAGILPETARYDEIVDTIKDLGYEVKPGANARLRYGYLAGTDEERVTDLNAMFLDEEVDAILPFRGGWGSNRILSEIDYKAISKNPKPLIGFSDITSLQLAIFTRTGLVSFHGPVGKSEWTDFTLSHFMKVLSGHSPVELVIPENDDCGDCTRYRCISGGTTTGRLLGGNLTVLTSMMGSRYLPEWEGSILFLEDVGEDVYRIDRMLTQLKLNGVLDKISGFIFGQCTGCDPSNSYSLTLEEVLDDHVLPLGIPAYQGAMIGHIDDIWTVPIGIRGTMNADKGMLTLNEAAVVSGQ